MTWQILNRPRALWPATPGVTGGMAAGQNPCPRYLARLQTLFYVLLDQGPVALGLCKESRESQTCPGFEGRAAPCALIRRSSWVTEITERTPYVSSQGTAVILVFISRLLPPDCRFPFPRVHSCLCPSPHHPHGCPFRCPRVAFLPPRMIMDVARHV